MLSELFTALSRLKSPKQSQTESSKSSASSVSLQAQSPELSSKPSWISKATDQIKKDEGCVLYAYDDHLGYSTIGYGRLIDRRKGGGISQDEAEYLLNNDIDRVLDELSWKLSWYDTLDDARQAVLLNMAFQLGVAGLLKFKNTLAYIEAGDYENAAANMLKSKWATQTPARAKRMADQMRTGQWQS